MSKLTQRYGSCPHKWTQQQHSITSLHLYKWTLVLRKYTILFQFVIRLKQNKKHTNKLAFSCSVKYFCSDIFLLKSRSRPCLWCASRSVQVSGLVLTPTSVPFCTLTPGLTPGWNALPARRASFCLDEQQNQLCPCLVLPSLSSICCCSPYRRMKSFHGAQPN